MILNTSRSSGLYGLMADFCLTIISKNVTIFRGIVTRFYVACRYLCIEKKLIRPVAMMCQDYGAISGKNGSQARSTLRS